MLSKLYFLHWATKFLFYVFSSEMGISSNSETNLYIQKPLLKWTLEVWTFYTGRKLLASMRFHWAETVPIWSQNSATIALGGANKLLSALSCLISILHSVLVALRIFWKHFLHQQDIWDYKIQFHIEAHSKLQDCGNVTRKFFSLWGKKKQKQEAQFFWFVSL